MVLARYVRDADGQSAIVDNQRKAFNRRKPQGFASRFDTSSEKLKTLARLGPVVNGECLGTIISTPSSNSYGSSSNSQPRYKSNSGAQYQYDLNKPGDNMRYRYDYDALRRDKMNTNPRRNMDKKSGQSGGGIYNSW